jgi:colanic acid biosynthesis glycosyl transferase WcaI
LKLIFLNRYFYPDISATSQILTDLAFYFARDGHEVHVIACRQRYDKPSANLPAEERAERVHIHRVWTTRFGRSNLWGRGVDYASFYASAGAALRRLARQGDVIVAETDPPLISVVAAWIAKRRGAVLVNWIQDLFPEVAERLGVKWLGGLLGKLLRRLRDYSIRSAGTNVVLGELMARNVERCAAGAQVTVIPNWSDGRLVRPVSRDQNPLRSKWKLQGCFVVGYSGNMGRAHEFETILAACELLRDDARIAFLFTGSGRQKQWIEDESIRRSLANVSFQPFQPREQLALSLSVPDAHLITLLPSLEGLIVPSKFYGIAAAGRPTLFIGDKQGEIGALVERHRCGIAIASGDAHGLAAAIIRLAGNPDLTSDMGKRARTLFESEFDITTACSRWSKILLENKPPLTNGQ